MKPTAITIACAALLSAALPASAQDGNGHNGASTGRVFGNGVLSEHLSLYDVNDDGALSVEEYQALKADRQKQGRHQRFRTRWDLNHDGRIDARERQHAVSEIRKVIEARRLRRFAEVDTDSDRNLTLSEFLLINAVASSDLNSPGMGEKIFNHLDLNQDHLVSEEEFLARLDSVRPVQVPSENSKPRPDLQDSPLARPINPADPGN